MSDSDITILLGQVNDGDAQALDQLVRTIYTELRRLSAGIMRKEAPGHTLQPTALVNEAFIRLIQGDTKWENRAHFFGAAARAMRRILVEHARARAATKRGGEACRVTFDDLAVASEDRRADILALEEALSALEKENPRLGKVVELRYFAGFSIDETARLLDVSPATIKRDWLYARAWLFAYIGEGRSPS